MEILLAHFQWYQKFLRINIQRTPRRYLLKVPSSRNAQYLNKDIVILSRLKKVEVDMYVNR